MKKVVKILSLVFALTLIFSLAACSGADTETTEETTTEPPIVSKTPQPTTGAEALAYFNRVMDAVKTGKPAVSVSVSKDIKNVETDNDKLKAAIPTVKKYMLNTKADGVSYGDDLTDIFPVKGQDWVSRLTLADVRYATCLEAKETYEISVHFRDEAEAAPLSSSLGKAFDLVEKSTILEEFKKAEGYLRVDDFDLTYTGCYIVCSVDRATDEVRSVTYYLYADASTTVVGAGELKDIGDVPLSLRYESKITYTLDWTVPE